LLESTEVGGIVGQMYTVNVAYGSADTVAYVPMRSKPAASQTGNLKWRHEATETASGTVLMSANESTGTIFNFYEGGFGTTFTLGLGQTLMRDSDADAGMLMDAEL